MLKLKLEDINMTTKMMEQKSNAIESFLAYTLPTYILVLPTFVINQLNLPTWIAFTIASIPFSGRIAGALIYQYLLKILGSRIVIYLSFSSLGILSATDGIFHNAIYLLISRFLIGVFFGISTSIAINEALLTRSKFITSLTMSGWAVGWMGGSIAYALLHYWELIAISGLITLPFTLTYKSNIKTSNVRYQFPPLLAILTYFLAFEPAFALTLAPYVLEKLGDDVLVYMIISYSLSIPIYLLGAKLERFLSMLLVGIIVSGILFFYFNISEALFIFTALGLGINAIAPTIAQRYGANPLNAGIALNIAAIGGTIIPIVFSNSIKSISILTLITMIILLFLERARKEEKITI
ncbi:transporter [Sulfurisphaera javensis]